GGDGQLPAFCEHDVLSRAANDSRLDAAAARAILRRRKLPATAAAGGARRAGLRMAGLERNAEALCGAGLRFSGDLQAAGGRIAVAERDVRESATANARGRGRAGISRGPAPGVHRLRDSAAAVSRGSAGVLEEPALPGAIHG